MVSNTHTTSNIIVSAAPTDLYTQCPHENADLVAKLSLLSDHLILYLPLFSLYFQRTTPTALSHPMVQIFPPPLHFLACSLK